MRNHCSPKISNSPPTTTRSASIGMVAIAGPSAPTMTARAPSAAATPHAADRQLRVTPTARTIVNASTISTAEARNAAATSSALCIEFLPLPATCEFVAYTTAMIATVATATDSFAERVAERGAAIAPAERRVATGLLELGAEASVLSAAVLAARLGTSDATIVRTAKALGYSGLAELRRALVAQPQEPAIGERLRRSLEQAPRAELFSTAISNHLRALDELTGNVSAQQFDAAIAVLSASARIVWRGLGPSAYLAAYGELLTRRVGKPSAALVSAGTAFADELLTLTEGDAIVLLAYGRPQPHVRVLLDRAASLGLPVVLITDTAGRRLAASVHTTLECGRGAPGLFASHGTTLVVLEALVLAIAAADRATAEASLDELNDLRAALAGRRIDVDAP